MTTVDGSPLGVPETCTTGLDVIPRSPGPTTVESGVVHPAVTGRLPVEPPLRGPRPSVGLVVPVSGTVPQGTVGGWGWGGGGPPTGEK